MDDLRQWSTEGPGLEDMEAGNTIAPALEGWRAALDTAATIIMTCNTISFMLGMGAAIYVRELWHHTKKPIGAVIGILGQFLVLPATGFCLSVAFQLRPYEALGVLMVSCSPGGTFSNFFTYWANGDLALSILMTACSSVLALGGMPFNLWLYSKYWLADDVNALVIPFGSIMTSLAFITAPAIVGMLVRHFHKRAAELVTRVMSVVGWLGVGACLCIWLFLYWRVFLVATPFIYLAAILLPTVGFCLSFILARIGCQDNRVARTIGIETGCQNMPVALSIILLSFTDPEIKSAMLLFPALYGILLVLEAMLGIAAFQLYVRSCGKGSADPDFPVMHRARVESGTLAEKRLLRA